MCELRLQIASQLMGTSARDSWLSIYQSIGLGPPHDDREWLPVACQHRRPKLVSTSQVSDATGLVKGCESGKSRGQ